MRIISSVPSIKLSVRTGNFTQTDEGSAVNEESNNIVYMKTESKPLVHACWVLGSCYMFVFLYLSYSKITCQCTQAFIGEESVSHTFLLKGRPSASVLYFSQHR